MVENIIAQQKSKVVGTNMKNISYDETEEILVKWEEIRDRYYPECDSYVNMKDVLMHVCSPTDNVFEYQERAEEKKKFKFYQKRSVMSLSDLISMAQYRISFYGIFSLSDDVRMANLKAKKIRNQLRIVKDDLEVYKEELKVSKLEIYELK